MYQRFYSIFFRKQLKQYGKKYHTITSDVLIFLRVFNPDQAASLGNNLYKARLQCTSLDKGKSGSFRIIVLLLRIENIIAPVALFYKGDEENIPKNVLQGHVKKLFNELRNTKFR